MLTCVVHLVSPGQSWSVLEHGVPTTGSGAFPLVQCQGRVAVGLAWCTTQSDIYIITPDLPGSHSWAHSNDKAGYTICLNVLCMSLIDEEGFNRS